MKERKRFLLYYDWENLIQDMSDSDIASLTRWIFKYQNTWEISDMTYWAKLAFSFMRPVFDEDRKDWEEVREVRRKAWSEWWKAKASKLKQNVANASTTKHDIAVIGIDSVSGIGIVTDITETDTTIVVWEQALVVAKWNTDINELLETIKWQVEFLWLIYKKGKYERERAKNILTGKDFWEVCEKANMPRVEFCKQIIFISSKLDFWNWKVYNAETIYKHYAQVYNEARNKKQELENKTPKVHENPLCRF